MRTLFLSLFLSFCFISDALAIDINTANASELTNLNGVGPVTAAKIIEYRNANGAFASCDDLTKVKGIGAKTLEKIKPDCTAGGEVAPAAANTDQPATTPSANAIDINTADEAALTKFKGVGTSTAAKIIEYRNANGAFASCDDLSKVKGIGAKTLENIKPDCTASQAE